MIEITDKFYPKDKEPIYRIQKLNNILSNDLDKKLIIDRCDSNLLYFKEKIIENEEDLRFNDIGKFSLKINEPVLYELAVLKINEIICFYNKNIYNKNPFYGSLKKTTAIEYYTMRIGEGNNLYKGKLNKLKNIKLTNIIDICRFIFFDKPPEIDRALYTIETDIFNRKFSNIRKYCAYKYVLHKPKAIFCMYLLGYFLLIILTLISIGFLSKIGENICDILWQKL
jgi:hypothetical protein